MSSDVSMSVQMNQWRLLSCLIPLCVRLMRLQEGRLTDLGASYPAAAVAGHRVRRCACALLKEMVKGRKAWSYAPIAPKSSQAG